MRSRCILFLELYLSIIPQRVQSAPSVTKCGSAISATLVHTSSKFIVFEFITSTTRSQNCNSCSAAPSNSTTSTHGTFWNAAYETTNMDIATMCHQCLTYAELQEWKYVNIKTILYIFTSPLHPWVHTVEGWNYVIHMLQQHLMFSAMIKTNKCWHHKVFCVVTHHNDCDAEPKILFIRM